MNTVKSNFFWMKRIVVMLVLSIVTSLAIAQHSLVEMSLAEGWQMRDALTEKWLNAIVPGCVHSDLLRNKLIQDPYYRTNEKQLQWIDKRDWEYKTSFDMSEELIGSEHLELNFKGLDTFADVYLNGQLVLSSDNMFREWVVDAKPFLHRGKNNLRVYFHSPINKGLELLKEYGMVLKAGNDQAEMGGLTKDQIVSPFIRKAPYHFGWDWGPRFVTSGIWKPVSIRAWNEVKMEDFFVAQQSLTDKLAVLKGQIEIQSTKKQKVQIAVSVNDKQIIHQSVELTVGLNNIEIPFNIKNPKRWWTNGLGNPNLYTITANVISKNVRDKLTREIGLRTLRLVQNKDSAGHTFYFELNGVPVFAKGENHIPNDMFSDRMTKDVYDWEINTAKKSNLNMLRVWGGGIYEDDYFYELCDKNGILIWQDFMFACSIYPGNDAFLNSVTKEAEYQVKRLRNHPCIALWCGNNEIDVAWQNYNPTGGWSWKQSYTTEQNAQIWTAYTKIFKDILPAAVGSFSPQVAYWQSSPATVDPKQHATDTNKDGDVHYWGVWWANHPFEKFADNIGRFMSEYGFQSFPELETVKKYALPEDFNIESEVMLHHQRSSIGNKRIIRYMDMYYRKPIDFEKFLYVGQVLQAYGIRFAIESHRRAMPYNMGSLVWQINDCWPVASWSSSDYYHRWKALQYEIKRSFEPVLISAFADGDKTSIKIISDRLAPISAQLEMNVCDFTGKVLRTRTIPIVLKPNAVTSVINELTAKLTDDVNGNYMILTLKGKEVVIAERTYFFTQPKNLNLTKPTIISTIHKQDSDWVITLKSDVLVKDLYLNFPATEGFFDNNYFDLLPGNEREIRFTPKDKSISIGKLELTSLVDSY